MQHLVLGQVETLAQDRGAVFLGVSVRQSLPSVPAAYPAGESLGHRVRTMQLPMPLMDSIPMVGAMSAGGMSCKQDSQGISKIGRRQMPAAKSVCKRTYVFVFSAILSEFFQPAQDSLRSSPGTAVSLHPGIPVFVRMSEK